MEGYIKNLKKNLNIQDNKKIEDQIKNLQNL